MGSQPSTLYSQLLQQHFDLLADQPDAVAKMRELTILDCAGSLPRRSAAKTGAQRRQRFGDDKPGRGPVPMRRRAPLAASVQIVILTFHVSIATLNP